MLRRVRRRQNNAEPPLDCDGDPRSGEASPTRAQRMRTARGRLRFVALPPAPSTTRGRPWEALPHRTRRGWHVPTRRGATANEPSPSLVYYRYLCTILCGSRTSKRKGRERRHLGNRIEYLHYNTVCTNMYVACRVGGSPRRRAVRAIRIVCPPPQDFRAMRIGQNKTNTEQKNLNF